MGQPSEDRASIWSSRPMRRLPDDATRVVAMMLPVEDLCVPLPGSLGPVAVGFAARPQIFLDRSTAGGIESPRNRNEPVDRVFLLATAEETVVAAEEEHV